MIPQGLWTYENNSNPEWDEWDAEHNDPNCHSSAGESANSQTDNIVFILSLSELNEYLPGNTYRVSTPNAYKWVLRSPGDGEGYYVSFVDENGNVLGDQFADSHMHGVRPAVWVSEDLLDDPSVTILP